MDSKSDKQKVYKQLIATLEKSPDEKVVSMLMGLREHGELFYLEALLDILTGERSEIVKKSVAEFIADIKKQEAVPIIANYVSANQNAKNLTRIVTACWQSRLDFSKNLQPFFQILLDGNYRIAFEAFTVIENTIELQSKEELTKNIDLVKRSVSKADRDKQLLLLEMISVLDKAKRAAN